jgi:hypothetical protein
VRWSGRSLLGNCTWRGMVGRKHGQVNAGVRGNLSITPFGLANKIRRTRQCCLKIGSTQVVRNHRDLAAMGVSPARNPQLSHGRHALGTAFVLSFEQQPQREYSRLRMVRPLDSGTGSQV